MNTRTFVILTLAISLLLGACAPAATEAPVVQTARAEAAAIESTQLAAAKAAEDNAKATAIMAEALGTPTATATQVLRPADTVTPLPETVYVTSTTTATLVPATMEDSNIVYLVGGKLVDGIGYEIVSKTTLEYISQETSLQMFFNQLVPTGFTNTYNISANEEICNDGGCAQWLVYERDGVWQVIEISRDFSIRENFSQISCIKFTDWTLTVWVDDAGTPGTWTGNCSGTYQVVYTKATLEQMKSSPDFSPYVAALLRAMEDTSDPFNRKIEIMDVFKK